MSHPYDPDYAVPPGRTIAEAMTHAGLTVETLSDATGLGVAVLEAIIDGSRHLEPTIGRRIADVLGIAPGLLANLEANYRSALARGCKVLDVSPDAPPTPPEPGPPAPPIGRKSPNQVKAVTVSLRLTSKQADRLTSNAANKGMSVSQFVRLKCCKTPAKRKKSPKK